MDSLDYSDYNGSAIQEFLLATTNIAIYSGISLS